MPGATFIPPPDPQPPSEEDAAKKRALEERIKLLGDQLGKLVGQRSLTTEELRALVLRQLKKSDGQ